MFPQRASQALLLCVAAAVGTLAAPSVLLQVSGPSSVVDIGNLKVVTTVTNTGDEPLKLLNDPRSPLSDLPTDTFTITNPHGTSPDFIGIAVKYVPHVAIASDDPLVYTNLSPGQSVTIEHDLSVAYDFSTSGTGPYVVNVKEFNTLYYVSQGHISALLAGNNLPNHAVNISGSLIASRARTPFSLDAEECENWQERAILTAIPVANKYIGGSLNLLAQDGYTGDHYKRWFGSASEHRLSTVGSHFEALIGNNFTEFTFVCKTAFCSRKPGLYAYVYPDEFGRIHVCDTFFRSPVGGPDSRASTIVHESSHFTRNGGTLDHAYGQTLTQELARSYPQLAVMNADNHEYFSAASLDNDVKQPPVLLTQVHFGGESFRV
ncbi:Peptidyl-Lys metalloendopeptidase [Trametes pubescens]|uniref:Peptidyl-Lys metalloendopeptidase n=1 Tax=Trametes pubescens TaxID=154538 RepID=A0A1M2VFQ4_TRAPU|nr:Peptidyl-Lys metalloendopeptidase [Trametes pubescens]